MATFLKIAGDYTRWNVYLKSVIICDVTELFIRKYLPRDSRTVDQMRQAARSCKQNIVEGHADYTISAEMGIKLFGVARGSLRELLEDYRDYLRQNGFTVWQLNDARSVSTRRFCRNNDKPETYIAKCDNRPPETIANIMVTLCCQLDSMLAGVLKKLQAEFVVNGGIKEQMSQVRRQWRKDNLGY